MTEIKSPEELEAAIPDILRVLMENFKGEK